MRTSPAAESQRHFRPERIGIEWPMLLRKLDRTAVDNPSIDPAIRLCYSQEIIKIKSPFSRLCEQT
jgi:hypothetical protein